MLSLAPDGRDRPLRLLCVGAHSDDLEIGCGGTVLEWLSGGRSLEICWVVLSAEGPRGDEARSSARELLQGATASRVVIGDFPDCYFQARYADVKAFFEELKTEIEPDVVFSHRLDDRHQDHRLAAELTWNTWRNHLILEYEIPKYEGDLSTPTVYIPLSAPTAQRKVDHLERAFGSQRSKDWFDPLTFQGLMRIRGVESRAPSGFAEAFHARKLIVSSGPTG